jgi:uncharacterized membrane protein YeaQ/YmgE (transglycosylase-associated protein family)
MNLTNILIWLATGALVGWLASKLFGMDKGLLGYIILGIIGGFVGGWLINDVLGLNFAGYLGTLLTAVIGSAVILIIAKLFSGK